MTTINASQGEVSDSVLRKFESLVNLMKRPGTEAEGLAAAARVQEFALRYGLSVDSFERKNESASAAKKHQGVEEDIKPQHGRRYKMFIQWKVTLLDRVCKANFCRASYYESGREIQFTVVGKPSNVKMAHLLYDYLEGVIDHITIQAILKRRADYKAKHGTGPGQSSTQGREWGDSFRIGMVEKVYERLIAEQKRASEEGYEAHASEGEGAVTAMVVRTAIENEQYDLKKYYSDIEETQRKENEKWLAQYRKEQAEIQAENQVAKAENKPAEKSKTKAQLEREERQNQRYWERLQKRQDAENRKQANRNRVKNADGYYAGQRAAEAVVLRPIESK